MSLNRDQENAMLRLSNAEIKRELEKYKEIEQELNESNQRFSDVLHNAQDAILLIDGEIFVDANVATARMLGYENREDFLNTHPSKLSPPYQPDGRQSFEKAGEMMKTAFDKGFHRFEWIHTKADGENFPVEVSLTPISYKGRNILHCLWRDLSLAKKMEIENAKMHQDIKQKELMLINSSKMATLGEMAGGIAHEINNPLTIIVGYLKVLEIEMKKGWQSPNQRVEQIIKDLNNTVMRISKIIQGLHAFAREKKFEQPMPVHVRNLVQSTISFCNEKFKNHDIDFRVGEIPENFFVMGNETQLSQVLLNLLNNAYDAVDGLEKKIIEVEVWINLAKNRIDLRVKDNGSGIPKEIRDKIMNPFFTTKQTGQGTGLGLSISHSIIKQHNGDLYLDNDCSQTCFVMSLPRQGA